MNNLHPLKWRTLEERAYAKTIFRSYHVTRDAESKDKFCVYYGSRTGKPASGFATIEDAKHWAEHEHYAGEMQPYVKPSPTWISVDDRLPETDILFKEFLVYDNLNNKVSHDYWNNEQREWNHYQNHVTHWMPLPDFSEVTK